MSCVVSTNVSFVALWSFSGFLNTSGVEFIEISFPSQWSVIGFRDRSGFDLSILEDGKFVNSTETNIIYLGKPNYSVLIKNVMNLGMIEINYAVNIDIPHQCSVFYVSSDPGAQFSASNFRIPTNYSFSSEQMICAWLFSDENANVVIEGNKKDKTGATLTTYSIENGAKLEKQINGFGIPYLMEKKSVFIVYSASKTLSMYNIRGLKSGLYSIDTVFVPQMGVLFVPSINRNMIFPRTTKGNTFVISVELFREYSIDMTTYDYLEILCHQDYLSLYFLDDLGYKAVAYHFTGYEIGSFDETSEFKFVSFNREAGSIIIQKLKPNAVVNFLTTNTYNCKSLVVNTVFPNKWKMCKYASQCNITSALGVDTCVLFAYTENFRTTYDIRNGYALTNKEHTYGNGTLISKSLIIQLPKENYADYLLISVEPLTIRNTKQIISHHDIITLPFVDNGQGFKIPFREQSRSFFLRYLALIIIFSIAMIFGGVFIYIKFCESD